MAPLIVHGVSDEELFVGDDGIKRPYAMVFSHQEGLHRRRGIIESGSFGKSTRRSRSRTNTPGATGSMPRQDATVDGADKIFGSWLSTFSANAPSANNNASSNPSNPSSTAPSKSSGLSQTTLATDLIDDPIGSPAAAAATKNAVATRRMQPTEVLLRGYRSAAQQYAAVNHYEQLAGRICEDYPREPPAEQRRYKSELRDRAVTAARRLTPEERRCVNKAASGAHWIKVTFESAEAADAALYASPQTILGHIVTAELWTGNDPVKDEAVLDMDMFFDKVGRESPKPDAVSGPWASKRPQRPVMGRDDVSPITSQSSHTLNTTTLSSNSSATINVPSSWPEGVTGDNHKNNATDTDATPADAAAPHPDAAAPDSLQCDPNFCRRIPTARRLQLLPVEKAVLPGRTWGQWLLAVIPFLRWFTGSMIGDEVPRTELGDFDWYRASLYWKLIWWLDATFGLFGGEILSAADKDD